jgi:DNA-binding GntR family transcriptional regulator
MDEPDPSFNESAADPADPQAAPKRPLKLSQLAYIRFKENLFSRRIPVGATLTQSELVALLDVPVGALREALQLLESQGLLTMLPRSGIRIIKPDMTLMKDSFQLRRILECEGVRKYAERASAEELARWDTAHRDTIAQAQSGMAEAALLDHAREVDQGFHKALIGALRNPQIEEVYARANERILLVRLDNLYMLSTVAVIQTMQEHLAVLDALRAHDIAAAIAAVENHLARALHRAMGF